MQPGGYGMPGGYGPPPGYGAPPPKPKGPSLGAVIVFAAIGALFVVPAIIGGVLGFQRARERAEAKKAPGELALSERYATKNGLIVAHYPSDFGAKRLDDATIIISRRVGTTGDEFVTLGALPIDKSVTDDVEEFARLMLVSVEKNIEAKDGTFTRGKRRETKCVGKYDGVEFKPTFTLPGVGDYVGRACFFTHNDRHYVIRYDVIKSHADSDTPVLQKIVEATEIKE